MIMLDINFIRENSEKIKKAVLDKDIDMDIDQLLELDDKRRALTREVEELHRQRNAAAKNKDMTFGRKIKENLSGLDQRLREAEEEYEFLMLKVPNIPSKDSPVGPDSRSNQEIKRWGEIPRFSFQAKDHLTLGESLDIIDTKQGVKVSGFRGYYLKNEGALTHWSLLQLALDRIIGAGFNLLVPPTLVHERVLVGSGHFPFGKDNIYQITHAADAKKAAESKNPLFLAGTSEPSLLAYFMDKTINEEELPLKLCALTQCYRSEVGDYGKDTRGLFRVHEFTKVEQVVICGSFEQSEQLFDEIQNISERLLQDLALPYRVMNISTGDMGVGKYKMFDVEAWMPSRESFGETHSNSNLTDWQARRLNMKFKTKDGKVCHCFTLNNTVIASPRILIALFENYQQEDGSIKIPEILTPYAKLSEIKPKK